MDVCLRDKTVETRNRARNLIFSACVCLILFGPGILFCFERTTGFELPVLASSKMVSYLTGGRTETGDISDVMSFEALTQGLFQSAVEDKVENNIPFRAQSLLFTSSLQKELIGASNIIFNWSAYPTFYGSTYFYVNSENSITAAPITDFAVTLDNARKIAEGMNSVALKHPDLDFVICLADRIAYSECNPVAGLISDPFLTTVDCLNALERHIDVENVYISCHNFADMSEYYKYYYTSDHHWSGYGALDAYGLFADDLKLKNDVEDAIDNLNFQGLVMNGSSARSGRYLLNEKVNEPCFIVQGLSASSGYSAPVLQGEAGVATLLDDPYGAEFDFYHDWYGPSVGTVITNEREVQEKALLVGDSYTSAMQWLIAQNYEETYVYLDFHGRFSGSESLEDRIEESDCSTVYLVFGASGFDNLLKSYPDYFES